MIRRFINYVREAIFAFVIFLIRGQLAEIHQHVHHDPDSPTSLNNHESLGDLDAIPPITEPHQTSHTK